MRILRSVALVLLSSLWSSVAFGEDESVVATARQFGEEGLAAYDAGRYDEATQKLIRAYQIVKVPTFARNAARALVKQGRLVAASELYLEATRLVPSELWRGEVQQQAQREATEERAALQSRIAHLKIVVDGADAQEVQATLDGVGVPGALLGADRLTDPGKRHLVAKRGDQVVEQDIELQEGEHKDVVVQFAPPKPQESAPKAPVQSPNKVSRSVAIRPTEPVPARETTPASSTQRTLGWVGVGVGAAGLALGAGSGIAALLMRSSMHSDGCNGDACPNSSFQGRIDTYNAMLTVSTVGFVVGAIGGIAGATLLLTSPRPESEARVGVVFGPGSVTIAGGF